MCVSMSGLVVQRLVLTPFHGMLPTLSGWLEQKEAEETAEAARQLLKDMSTGKEVLPQVRRGWIVAFGRRVWAELMGG